MTKLTVVTYHYVRPIKHTKFYNLKGLELNIFKKQLIYLKKKYNIISYKDLIEIALNKKKIIKNPCLLTFDDGYKDHIRFVLPELIKKKIKGCFFPSVYCVEKKKILNINKIHFILAKKISANNIFIELMKIIKNQKNKYYKKKYSTKNIIKIKKKYKNNHRFDNKDVAFIKYLLQIYLPKKLRNLCCDKLFKLFVSRKQKKFSENLYMSTSDLKKLLKKGMYVGGHGYNHEHLNKLNFKEQKNEINKNYNFLKKINSPIRSWGMCYPHGSYNANTLKILKNKGCAFGFTTKKGNSNLASSNFLELKRLDTNDIKLS